MRLFGHPIHPMLAHFPIAFWSVGTACDGLALLGIEAVAPYAAPSLGLGLIMAAPAMAAGAVDLARAPNAATADANRHMLLMASAWTVYLAALLVRLETLDLGAAPMALPVILSATGFALTAAGGWFGGRLVFHHGAGTRFAGSDE